VGLEFLDPVGDDEARFFLQPGRAGEQRRRVPIGSHAEQDEIEARELSRPERKKILQSFFVGFGRGCGVGILCGNSEYVSRRHRNLRQHGLFRHFVVAVRIGGRHVPLIAPEKKNAIPGEDCASVRRQQIEQALGSRSSRKRNRESSTLGDRFRRGAHDFLRRRCE
jgi:hypothetical protein